MKSQAPRPRSGRLQGSSARPESAFADSGLEHNPAQGEALAGWATWAVVALAVLVTYSWVDPAELYHVSSEGLEGGLSRAAVLLNFPVALVAIAFVLIAVAALPAAAWWFAAPAIACCAFVPFTVDQDDLDVRWRNAIPIVGVILALALTVAATRRAGASFAPRRRGDSARVIAAAVVLVMSLPWIAAELGFHLPGDVFLGEEPYPEKDGTVIAAVHLGHHHGGDGTWLVLTALLLSRVRVRGRRLRVVLAAYLGLMLSYGAVNLTQDFWREQVVKRGWVETDIPSALLPGFRPIWLVIVGIAVLATVAFLRENERAPAPVPA